MQTLQSHARERPPPPSMNGVRRAGGAVDGFCAGEVQLVGARAAGDVGQDIVPNSYMLWVASDPGAATFSVTLAPGARTGAHAVALAVFGALAVLAAAGARCALACSVCHC